MKSFINLLILVLATVTAMIFLETTLAQKPMDNLQCHILVVLGGRNNSDYCCSDNQCKSTICSEHECKCKAVGGACGRGVECCSGNCSKTRKCACADLQGVCETGGDCCSGVCATDKTCGPKSDGGSCGLNTDCLSNMCNPNGVCGCKKAHEECTNDSDCCLEGGITCSGGKCCIRPGLGVNPVADSCCSGIVEGSVCA